MKVVCFLSNGFEEIEAITPVDVLRRAGIDCEFYSINELDVEGAHGIKITADHLLTNDDDLSNVDMIILPGGMPGAQHLADNAKVQEIIKDFYRSNKYIAAICAAPALALGKSGIIEGKNVTCYPGMEDNIPNSNYIDEVVVQDGNIITSQGPSTALPFAFKLLKVLKGDSHSLEYGMLWNKVGGEN